MRKPLERAATRKMKSPGVRVNAAELRKATKMSAYQSCLCPCGRCAASQMCVYVCSVPQGAHQRLLSRTERANDDNVVMCSLLHCSALPQRRGEEVYFSGRALSSQPNKALLETSPC